MSETVFLFVAAAIALGLIPIVPKMMWLRIKVLRFLRLNWLADFHHRHIKGITMAVRVIISGIAVVLVTLGVGKVG